MSYVIFDMVDGTYLRRDYQDHHSNRMWIDDAAEEDTVAKFETIDDAYFVLEDIDEDKRMRSRVGLVYVTDVADTERAPS